MLFSFLLVLVAQAQSTKLNHDIAIVNLVLSLEYVERAIFQQGLEKFDPAAFTGNRFTLQVKFIYRNLHMPARVRARVTEVASHSDSIIDQLNSILEAAGVTTPVPACSYKFITPDLDSFLTAAQTLQSIAISAYLGIVKEVTDPEILMACVGFLTTKARHNSFIRKNLKLDPFPAVADTPLDFNQVYTLIKPYIISCPPPYTPSERFPFVAYPTLTIRGTKRLRSNQQVIATFDGRIPPDAYAVFLVGPDQITVPFPTNGVFRLPSGPGVFGQNYVLITSDNKTMSRSNIIAGPAIIEIGNHAHNYPRRLTPPPFYSNLPISIASFFKNVLYDINWYIWLLNS